MIGLDGFGRSLRSNANYLWNIQRRENRLVSRDSFQAFPLIISERSHQHCFTRGKFAAGLCIRNPQTQSTLGNFPFYRALWRAAPKKVTVLHNHQNNTRVDQNHPLSRPLTPVCLQTKPQLLHFSVRYDCSCSEIYTNTYTDNFNQENLFNKILIYS